MNKTSIWKNQAFCFRMSIVAIFVWLAISSTISLIMYFPLSDEFMDDIILDFSTWLFIIPAITAFGLINAIPLMLDWVLEPFEDMDEDKMDNKKKNTQKFTSYSQLTSRLESPDTEKT